MSNAVQSVDDSDLMLKITGVISLFIQTMEVIRSRATFARQIADTVQSWQFNASALNRFLMSLFERYVSLLKKRNADDLLEVRAGPVATLVVGKRG